MKRMIYTIIMLSFVLFIVGCNDDNDKNIYTLNDILGYDKSEITKAEYEAFSLNSSGDTLGVMYNTSVEYVIEALDVAYALNTTSNEFLLNDFITTFYLYRNMKVL